MKKTMPLLLLLLTAACLVAMPTFAADTDPALGAKSAEQAHAFGQMVREAASAVADAAVRAAKAVANWWNSW